MKPIMLIYGAIVLLIVSNDAYGVGLPKSTYHLIRQENGSYLPVKTSFHNDRFKGIAKAHYQRLINETGWAILQIETDGQYPDEEQVYAAGYLEALLTRDIIYMHWFNTLSDFCSGRDKLCAQLDEFIQDNVKWIESKIQLAKVDPFWHQVNLFYKQIQGLADGYKAANKDPNQNLKFNDILWLNLQGDFDDLMEVLQAREDNFVHKEGRLSPLARGLGHCSALIKVLPNTKELFVSQVTWNTYQSMLRVLKKYTFNVHQNKGGSASIAGRSMSFSSYPGTITSGDDFYLISSGLVTLETTIGNGNTSLWQFVKSKGQVFEGVRSMVANRLADTGRTWAKVFSRYNSGTYNNQWMIVDYNKFNSSQGKALSELPNDTLWVLEQLPNYVIADDMTEKLRAESYWPSYNVAAFPMIFNISGNQEMVRKFGNWFTYENTPRALIFKRDHGKVVDIKSMYNLMRYNDYKNDPLSSCDCSPPYSAENAISARCDLNPANGTYPFPALGHRQHGSTDAKVTSYGLFLNGLSFMAVSGPTFNDAAGIPPFQWSESDFESSTAHMGHPDKWDFAPFIKQWA